VKWKDRLTEILEASSILRDDDQNSAFVPVTVYYGDEEFLSGTSDTLWQVA
jgi:hypothetical protein